MITSLRPLSVGNAVRVYVTPPAGAVCWRVLRRTADAFTGADDTGAVVVAAASSDNVLLDTEALVNGTVYFYRDYTSADGGQTWTDSGASLSATPAATYTDTSIDPQALVIERLELGLAVEVARGTLSPETGVVPVYSAPFALADNLSFPCVSVHADDTSSGDRVLGEEFTDGLADLSGEWEESEGWLGKFRLAIIGVSLNADERMALRICIRRVIQANFPVFADAGIVLPTLSQSDSEELLGQSNAPLYRSNGLFECMAPVAVSAPVLPISGVVPSPNIFGTDPLP